MKNINFDFDVLGGRSIDTVTDSEIDRFIYCLDNMIRAGLKAYYMLNEDSFSVLFTVCQN